jgi:hypothetical protein
LGLAALVCPALAWAAPPTTIRIDVDPRMELESVVRLLGPAAGDPEGFVRRDIPYARAIADHFAADRRHAAVRADSEPAFKNFKFSDRRQVLLRLSPPPALQVRVEMPYAFYERAGGRDKADAWLDGLRTFCRDAGFLDFLASSRGLLAPQVDAFRNEVARVDYLGKIEAYTGLGLLGSYSIALSPFDATGGVANEVAVLDDGAMEISSVIGPEQRPGAGFDFWSKRIPSVLWHESGHGIEDGMGDLFSDQIALSSASYQPSWNCYGDWQQCFKENVVRAVMIRLIAQEFGQAAADEQLAYETETRFPYLKTMLDRLRDYEKHRDRYPTLADFYPELVAVLPVPPPKRGTWEFSSVPSAVSGAPAAKRLRVLRYLEQIIARAKEPAVLAAARRARDSVVQESETMREPVGHNFEADPATAPNPESRPNPGALPNPNAPPNPGAPANPQAPPSR